MHEKADRAHTVLTWRSAQCDGKQAFDTFAMADRVARRAKGSVHAYRCPHCHMWHVGSRPRGSK